MKILHWFACKLGHHVWGPLVSVPFFQEEIDVRFCVHCEKQEPFVVPKSLSLGIRP
jgi:hypothetical protein